MVYENKHEDTGERCLVAHYDENGHLKQSCWKCLCGLWVSHGQKCDRDLSNNTITVGVAVESKKEGE